MIEKFISFSLNQKLLVIAVVILLIGFGIYSFLKLPIDAFPDVTNIQVEILCHAAGRSPLEVEKFVTYPVEVAMRGLPGLVQLRSVSKFGLSVITAIFEDGVDIYFARQLVLERLIEAKEKVPQGVKVSMGPISTAMGEIYQYTLEGKEPEKEPEKIAYLTELRTLQDWVISPILKTVPGVNEINSFGGYLKQYQVLIHPEKLLKYNLSLSEVVEAIAKNNRDAGGGIVEHHSEQFLVRGMGLIKALKDIEYIVLASHDGIPIFIRDIAEVQIGRAVRQGASIKNGEKEVVGGIVMMLRGANSREVVKMVEEKVKEINESNILPQGLKIKPFYKRSDIVKKSLQTVTRALEEGAIFVIIVLFLFLGNLRGALIVILALPLTVLLTFIVMKQTGLTANLMSLGGLAISIGMIVDATIIQVENVQRHLSEHKTLKQKLLTVLRAVSEVRKPSIFGELIIIFTFLPIMTLQGMEGKMFSPLAITVSIALFSALLLSIFVFPAFCHLILKPGKRRRTFLIQGIKKVYLPILRWVLNHRIPVLLVLAAIALVAFSLLPRLGTEFIPAMDEGAFDMDVQFLPGISLAKSIEISEEVERRLMKFPELETVVSRTGQTGIAIEARGVEKTGFVGTLRPRSEWKTAKTREELTDKMRDAISVFPGMAFSFSQPIACRIDELLAGSRAQIIIKLFGEELEVLKEKADEIAGIVSHIKGVKDLVVERISGQPYLSINIDREKIARYGINVDDVQTIIEVAIGGKPVTQIYEGDKYFDILIRFAEEKRNSASAIGNILLLTPRGFRVPLSLIADISLVEGPTQVSREYGRRRIGIELNISGRDIGGFVSEVKHRINETVSLPSGYYLSWGGQFENQQRAKERLMIVVPIALSLIFFFLFLSFNSLRLSFLIFLNLPFALIGGILALYLFGLYLSVPASIGFIALLGIAVLNGLVLVSYIKQLRLGGMSLKESIISACELRLRPILMTALTTIFGLTPLLFAQGPGSEVQRPLAVVVVGGLATSTLLTLLIIPVLYGWFEPKMKPEAS